jgi:hypothetical protein
MFVRLVFLLLVALNLGAATWLLFGRAPVRAFPPATDPGVPELRLWPDVAKAAPARYPVPVAPSSAAALAKGDTCTTLGPFTSAADMRAAMQALSPHVARIQYREEQVNRSHGYWVYLPAAPNREAALDDARRLAAKGIHDYYVVTAGDTENTISLGLFNDQANADRRLATVTREGFPARVAQRVDTAPAYWLDFAVPAGDAFEWQAWLPDRGDLQAKAIDCIGGAGTSGSSPTSAPSPASASSPASALSPAARSASVATPPDAATAGSSGAPF